MILGVGGNTTIWTHALENLGGLRALILHHGGLNLGPWKDHNNCYMCFCQADAGMMDTK